MNNAVLYIYLYGAGKHICLLVTASTVRCVATTTLVLVETEMSC